MGGITRCCNLIDQQALHVCGVQKIMPYSTCRCSCASSLSLSLRTIFPKIASILISLSNIVAKLWPDEGT